jgi:hypothetical protein
VGQFVFCREAWYLARQGVPVDAEGEERLLAGVVAHRRIGRRTDQVVRVERVRGKVLTGLAVMVGVVLLVVVTRVWVGGA